MTRRFAGDRLVLATHNKGKVEEIAHLLQGRAIALVSAGDLGLPVPEETETSFSGNASLKAVASAKATGLPALADDSGLEVDALGGAPGVWTADWAEGPEGRDFDRAMARVYDEVCASGVSEPWTARFRCCLALAWPDGHVELFEGAVEGTLIWPPRGALGHGFDPMFVPAGHRITFGEMDRWEKNLMSHRADAFARLVANCFT